VEEVHRQWVGVVELVVQLHVTALEVALEVRRVPRVLLLVAAEQHGLRMVVEAVPLSLVHVEFSVEVEEGVQQTLWRVAVVELGHDSALGAQHVFGLRMVVEHQTVIPLLLAHILHSESLVASVGVVDLDWQGEPVVVDLGEVVLY